MTTNSSGNSVEPEVNEGVAPESSRADSHVNSVDVASQSETGDAEDTIEPVRVMRESEVEALERERDELRDQALRIRAEFENYRKRVLRDADRNKQLAAESFVRGLLPVLDNLELALAHADDPSNALVKGIEMVHRQCLDVLQGFGVVPIDAAGAPFDPNVHDAVMQEASAATPENVVLRVFQRGYRLGDLVVRPAKVVVSKGMPGPAQAVAESTENTAG